MAERDWDNVFFATMAVASVVVGAIGVALVLTLRPQSSAGELVNQALGSTPLSVAIPKVHYQNNEYLVSVRDPGEWRELREFVQPYNPAVRNIVGSLYG
jgi:NO-binding membrane sensor protein with MHYT domain